MQGIGKLISPVVWIAMSILFVILFAIVTIVHLIADTASLGPQETAPRKGRPQLTLS
jgi:hypothetical protein